MGCLREALPLFSKLIPPPLLVKERGIQGVRSQNNINPLTIDQDIATLKLTNKLDVLP